METEDQTAMTENIRYIQQMLMELIPMAERCDGALGYLVSMAAIHSTDIQNGLVKAKPVQRDSVVEQDPHADQVSGEACLLGTAI